MNARHAAAPGAEPGAADERPPPPRVPPKSMRSWPLALRRWSGCERRWGAMGRSFKINFEVPKALWSAQDQDHFGRWKYDGDVKTPCMQGKPGPSGSRLLVLQVRTP